MRQFLSRHWLGIIGALPTLWRGLSYIIGRLGDVDLIVTHLSDPGWMRDVWKFALDPPGWTLFPAVAFTALLIWLDVRHRPIQGRIPAPPIKDRANIDDWRNTDPLHLWQAACLWKGYEPIPVPIGHPVAATYNRLLRAVGSGLLVPQKRWPDETLEWSLLSRSELKRFAISIGDVPDFLEDAVAAPTIEASHARAALVIEPFDAPDYRWIDIEGGQRVYLCRVAIKNTSETKPIENVRLKITNIEGDRDFDAPQTVHPHGVTIAGRDFTTWLIAKSGDDVGLHLPNVSHHGKKSYPVVIDPARLTIEVTGNDVEKAKAVFMLCLDDRGAPRLIPDGLPLPIKPRVPVLTQRANWPAANLGDWRKVDPVHIWRAGYLWKGWDPVSHDVKYSHPAHAPFIMLMNAAQTGELALVKREDDADLCWSLVSRAELKRVAVSKGDAPEFLKDSESAVAAITADAKREIQTFYNSWLNPAADAANNILERMVSVLRGHGGTAFRQRAALIEKSIIDEERAALSRLGNALNGVEPINESDLQDRLGAYFRCYQETRTWIDEGLETFGIDLHDDPMFADWLRLDEKMLDALRALSGSPSYDRLRSHLTFVGWGEAVTRSLLRRRIISL